MKNMKKGVLAYAMASGLALLGCTNTFAGNRPGAVTLTPGVGVEFFAQKRNYTNTSVLPEIAVSYNFDERWALEGSYNTFGTSSRGVTVKGNLWLVDVLYRFTPLYTRLEPYLTMGWGIYNLNPSGTNANNQGNINIGVGSQFFFTNSIAFRLEGRELYTWVGGKNDQMINFGVSFLIGGSEPVVATAAPYKGEVPVGPAATPATKPAVA
jgi:hypothetical protein